jgi:hypothetical protein
VQNWTIQRQLKRNRGSMKYEFDLRFESSCSGKSDHLSSPFPLSFFSYEAGGDPKNRVWIKDKKVISNQFENIGDALYLSEIKSRQQDRLVFERTLVLWLVKNGWPAVRRRLHMHACMAGLSIVGGAHVNRPAVGSSMRPCRCRRPAGSTSDQAPGPHDVRPAARPPVVVTGMHAMHRRPSSTRPHRARNARTNAWVRDALHRPRQRRRRRTHAELEAH